MILGGSRGLGRALGLQLIGQGERVVLVARSFAQSKELSLGLTIEGDLTQSDFLLNLKNLLLQQPGRLKMVFVCFATQSAGPLLGSTTHERQQVIAANICAPLEFALEFGELFENHKTKIIFIGSQAAFFPTPSMAIYCASKAFLRSWVLAWSQEVKFAVALFHPPPMGRINQATYVQAATRLLRFASREEIEGYYSFSMSFSKWVVALVPLRRLLEVSAKIARAAL